MGSFKCYVTLEGVGGYMPKRYEALRGVGGLRLGNDRHHLGTALARVFYLLSTGGGGRSWVSVT